MAPMRLSKSEIDVLRRVDSQNGAYCAGDVGTVIALRLLARGMLRTRFPGFWHRTNRFPFVYVKFWWPRLWLWTTYSGVVAIRAAKAQESSNRRSASSLAACKAPGTLQEATTGATHAGISSDPSSHFPTVFPPVP